MFWQNNLPRSVAAYRAVPNQILSGSSFQGATEISTTEGNVK